MSVQVQLSNIVTKLQERRPLQSLAPARVWDSSLDEAITSMVFHPEDLEASKEMIALKAGLHLFNDSLNLSHSYSQQIEDDATGCYWHGIMHRMEGDYSNANYWLRSAGSHPVKSLLNARVADWLNNGIILGELQINPIRETLVQMKLKAVGIRTPSLKLLSSKNAVKAPKKPGVHLSISSISK